MLLLIPNVLKPRTWLSLLHLTRSVPTVEVATRLLRLWLFDGS